MAANATAVVRVRPSGNNNNGGGYDAGIASAGTDFSQQNAAQVTQSGGTVSTATVTLTDTGASFTSALIGNGIRVAGTGITTTYTYVTAVPSGTTLTLQTSPGTTGTSVTYSIGGGWADFWTNTTSAAGWLQPGNICYILGSGTPNPSSYTYDYVYTGSGIVPAVGNSSTPGGLISFLNDPATPGYKAPPDASGGMPVIQSNTTTNGYLFNMADPQWVSFQGLYFVGANSNGNHNFVFNGGTRLFIIGCVLDQFGFTQCLYSGANNTNSLVLGCEVFNSSVTVPNPSSGMISGGQGTRVIGCNVHDCGMGFGSSGIESDGNGQNMWVQNCIVAKNTTGGGAGVTASAGPVTIINCTVDGNSADGISFVAAIDTITCFNNIITNHTGVGAFGINATGHQQAGFTDYNAFYNNTANYSSTTLGIVGAHDTLLGVTPYVASATENYTLA